jgi:hypothetical protein
LTVFSTLIWGFATCARGATDQIEAGNLLRTLLAQYRLPQTLHCKVVAVTEYKTIPPGIFRVPGSQEYWAEGSKYRILQLQDSSVFSGMSHDVRWDGYRFQWLNVADSTLFFSKRPQQITTYIGEPIALLPLEFLNPTGEQTGEKLSLGELVSRDFSEQVSAAHFLNMDRHQIELPGGDWGTLDYNYRIAFNGPQPFLPTTIKRITSDGIELTTDEISYRPVNCKAGVIYLPSTAKLTTRTTDNRTGFVETCTVSLIETDAPISPETFTLDFQTAKTVIDHDRPFERVSTPVASNSATTTTESEPLAEAPTDGGTNSFQNQDSSGNVFIKIAGFLVFSGGTLAFVYYRFIDRRRL